MKSSPEYNACIMGDVPENEQAWERYARANNCRCGACGQLIPFGERQVYFDRKLCGACAHKLDKSD